MVLRGWLCSVGVFWLVLCFACGGAQRASSPRIEPGWYAVQFKSARLPARRPGGAPWHTSASDRTAVVIGGLIGLAAGYPALGAMLGDAASETGGDPLAPAPFIDLKIAGETYRVSPAGRTYAPEWDQPIAIDARRLHGSERVIIEVRDGVDGSMIAKHETTLAELLGKPAQTLTQFDAPMSLDLTVERTPARRAIEYALVVPATVHADSLTARGSPGWRPIPVWNGDRVIVDAVGEVCPSSPSECFDPEGARPGRWRDYSYFKDAPHASLIAAAPDGWRSIGAHHSFEVTQSGVVLLLVNDDDVGNNTGGFEVRVTVIPPR